DFHVTGVQTCALPIYFLPWQEIEALLLRLEHACASLDQTLIREVLGEAIGGFVSKEVANDPMLEAQGAERESGKADGKILPLFRSEERRVGTDGSQRS